MANYATVNDVIALRGPQPSAVIERLPSIITAVSSQFRIEAKNYGKDLDQLIAEDDDLSEVTKSLVVDAAMQYYYSSNNTSPPISQFSQAAGGYSASGTFLNPGGGLYTKKSWLKMLGINKQKVGTIEIFDFGGCCSESD